MAVDAGLRCLRCAGVNHLIRGDGPYPVCTECVLELGAIANDPSQFETSRLWSMVRKHGDVVKLVRAAKTRRWEWRWRP